MNLSKDDSVRKDLVKEIIGYVREKCIKYSKESKMNFVVSETSKHRPLKKLIELDKSIYGIIPGVTDRAYYHMFRVKRVQ